MTETENEVTDNSEIIFSIRSLIIVYCIWSWPFTLFGLAVNEANRRMGEPIVFPFLSPSGSEGVYEFIFFPTATTADLFILLWLLRFVLPLRLKRKLVWNSSSVYQKEKPIKNAKPAIFTAVFGLAGTGVLYFAATHLRNDRSQRQPFIYWEGPAADDMEWILALGWTLSYLAVCGYVFVSNYFDSRWNLLAVVGVFFGCMNFILSCAIGTILQAD
ncbi:hypothetical protein [Gimesia fumaroli]|uniref:Uncharacterized protein n=1 Tax=Gimesia fumaroli TaxID=2527976 RepID=A0A518IB23_9PLAN|nr:hypothetical protein [Gimesia fumaroli]QDV50294.1 hypothetical protein Enr17x_23320 [Gimesia fumaroli]